MFLSHEWPLNGCPFTHPESALANGLFEHRPLYCNGQKVSTSGGDRGTVRAQCACNILAALTSPCPPPPPFDKIGPIFLPGLWPITNFLLRVWRQFVQIKNFFGAIGTCKTLGGWTYSPPIPS